MRTRLRGKVTLLFMMFALLLAIPAVALAQDAGDSTTSSPAPTIQSDQADYAPGDLVTLTGSGWQSGEKVNIFVNDDVGQTWSRSVDVYADASGNISDSFNLPEWFVATYSVKATGASGAVAITSFTDANLRFLSSGPTLSSVSWQKYSDSSCTTEISGTGNGGSGNITTTDSNSGTLTVQAQDNQYVGLTAPATAGGQSFVNWTRTSNNNAFTTSGPDNRTICAEGDDSSGAAKFTANYAVSDTNAPTVSSIDLADTNPTKAASVKWTVTFSESVTGVDIGDFDLTASSGLTGTSFPTTGALSGSGTTYTVTADTGTGSGTLGLNLDDDDSIVDGATNKLGGTGNDNGDFTGESYTIDRAAPTVSPTAVKGVAPNFVGATNYGEGVWTNQDVRVTFTCADTGGSGLTTASQTPDQQTFTTQSATTSGTTATFAGTCEDTVGNTATSDLDFTVKIDKTAPTIDGSASPAPNAAGWNNTNVTVSFDCVDVLSGVPAGNCPADVLLENDGADQSVTRSVTDAAGNTASDTVSGINIDKTAPNVSVTGVSAGGNYTLGSVPAAGCSTTDAISGVAQNASVNVTGGTPNGVGTFTATCSGASDNAGNPGSASATYTVAYGGVSGILQPINYDDSSIFSRGKAVPVKFKLAGDEPNGFNYSTWKLERVKVSCTDFGDEGTTFEQIVENPSQTFRYDQSADQYIINANFKNETVGTCWRVKVTLDDSSAPMVSPIFKIAK
jgi:hypothetical protein